MTTYAICQDCGAEIELTHDILDCEDTLRDRAEAEAVERAREWRVRHEAAQDREIEDFRRQQVEDEERP